MKVELARLLTLAIAYRRAVKKKKRRTYWVHPINQLRDTWGEHLKFDKMKEEYPKKFFEYTRMSPPIFDRLLELVRPQIEKKASNFREPIPPRIRLYVTLRYLATGDSLKTIALSYSLGHTTVWRIARETCWVIWNALYPIYLPTPEKTTWLGIANRFENRWNFPHCIGAIDGKHVIMQAPDNSGAMYFNYKKTFSLVLLALVDADYRFTVVDVGAYGKQSDGGIFAASQLGIQLKSNSLNVPEPERLPGCTSHIKIPYVIVGDDAFPLNTYMLRPYPGKFLQPIRRIFNYRLSRARRISENAFGIMASRFRIFRRPIIAAPHHVENVVKAAVALHNFLRTKEMTEDPQSRLYCPPGYADDGDQCNGGWRMEGPTGGLETITRTGKNNYTSKASEIRDELARYFNAEGAVHWQQKIISSSPAPEI